MFSCIFRRHRAVTSFLNFSSLSIGEKHGVVVAAPKANLMRVVVVLVVTKIELKCSLKSSLENIKIWDNVVLDFILNDTGRIKSLLERESEIPYPPVSNLDHRVLVFSVEENLKAHITSRFLVEAKSNEIPLTIVLNKTDLAMFNYVLQVIFNIQQFSYFFVPNKHNNLGEKSF
ncbi:hypothetical protein A2U01_0034786 [Trifolium medium]|uniref:EngC GTPase domain-containing protein n=1 Tax=Trifolium medium TaxID=97028 RepID=A0A392PPU7_9FABA|nr:hypothetical protein [Trifolium medium]